MATEKYRPLMALSYNTIGKAILTYLRLRPTIQEIKFIAQDERKIFYDSLILNEGEKIPLILGFIVKKKEITQKDLSDAVNTEFNQTPRPEKARIIRPSLKIDAWSIFFKK